MSSLKSFQNMGGNLQTKVKESYQDLKKHLKDNFQKLTLFTIVIMIFFFIIFLIIQYSGIDTSSYSSVIQFGFIVILFLILLSYYLITKSGAPIFLYKLK